MVKYLYMPFTFSLAMANLYAMDNTQQQTWDGKEYHDNSSKQFQAAMQIVEPLELSNEHILEIGCGSGRVTRVLAQKAAQGSILATDVQESMVVKAKEYCGDLPNVSFEVVDAHKLPYKDRFTRIFSFTALHWMEDQAAVLKGCYNALRPGGTILFTMSGKVDETHAFIRAYRMTAEEEEWAMLKTIDPLRQNYPQDKETLTSLLVDAGFQDVDVRERCLTYTFTREEFVHFVYSIFGGLVSFSQMKREQPALLMDLVRAIVANYEKVKKPDTEGKISHVLEGLVASGRKGNVR